MGGVNPELVEQTPGLNPLGYQLRMADGEIDYDGSGESENDRDERLEHIIKNEEEEREPIL